MSACKGADCTVQHRNPNCKGGRKAKELRMVEEERDQLRERVERLRELLSMGINVADKLGSFSQNPKHREYALRFISLAEEVLG